MATFDYVEKWWSDNTDLIEKCVDDPEKIFSSEYGHKKGAYLASVKLKNKNAEMVYIPMYAGEAGADDEHDRSIADRLKEHIRIWLGPYTEYWTGIRKSDLESGEMKIHVQIVGEAETLEKRKELERKTIVSACPYLQYGPYKKYDSKYDDLDLCIIPFNGTRRKAFINRAKKEGIDIKEESIVAYILGNDFCPDWKSVLTLMQKMPKDEEMLETIKANIARIKHEISPTTKEYKEIKEKVDKGLEIKGSRGCTYPYLVKVLSYALV